MDAKAYCRPYTLLLHMEYGLYSYFHVGVDIKIEPGDYIFDCGAALGDTAFIFADASRPEGKIFSFEPHPEMVTLLEGNLSLNPRFSNIEGAELDALLGAANYLKKFRPKLAISLYHKYGYFRVIPKFIESLNLGYKFYSDHQGMNE